jgi:hypothetical protein
MPSPKKLKSMLTAVAWRYTDKQPTQIKRSQMEYPWPTERGSLFVPQAR